MRRDRGGGQGELKSCAARRIVGSPQAASVRVDNRAADPESHTRAVSLGGKERIKDLVRLLCGQPSASIVDRDLLQPHLTQVRAYDPRKNARTLFDRSASDRELFRRRITMLLSPNPAVVFFCCFKQLEMAITRRRSASLA